MDRAIEKASVVRIGWMGEEEDGRRACVLVEIHGCEFLVLEVWEVAAQLFTILEE